MQPLAAREDHFELEALSDAEVVARIIAGDARLFELIMRRYNRRLFRLTRGILADDAEAEDAVQDAYVDAYFKLGQFRGPAGFATWLCRIACNHALMRRRRRRPTAPVETLDQAGQEASPMSTTTLHSSRPDSETQRRQLGERLEAAVDGLPEAYRETFVLREVEGLSLAETADVLGCNEATIKTRVFRARRLLRRQLVDELGAVLPELFSFDGERCDRLVTTVFRRLREAVGDF